MCCWGDSWGFILDCFFVGVERGWWRVGDDPFLWLFVFSCSVFLLLALSLTVLLGFGLVRVLECSLCFFRRCWCVECLSVVCLCCRGWGDGLWFFVCCWRLVCVFLLGVLSWVGGFLVLGFLFCVLALVFLCWVLFWVFLLWCLCFLFCVCWSLLLPISWESLEPVIHLSEKKKLKHV